MSRRDKKGDEKEIRAREMNKRYKQGCCGHLKLKKIPAGKE